MNDRNEQERRERRLELAERFAREVSSWSSAKLRSTYAQPEAVRRAEERELGQLTSLHARTDRT